MIPRVHCTEGRRAATSGAPSHLDICGPCPHRPIGQNASPTWVVVGLPPDTALRTVATWEDSDPPAHEWYVPGGSLLLVGVVQMTRTDRWLQVVADAALWLLFRLARVRS